MGFAGGADVVDISRSLVVVAPSGGPHLDPRAVERLERPDHLVGQLVPVGNADLKKLVVACPVEGAVNALGTHPVALRDDRGVKSVELAFVLADVATGVLGREIAEVSEERLVSLRAVYRGVKSPVRYGAPRLARRPGEATVVHVMVKELAGVEPLIVDLAIGGRPEFLERDGGAQVTRIVGASRCQLPSSPRVLAKIAGERCAGGLLPIAAQATTLLSPWSRSAGWVRRFIVVSPSWER